MPTAAEPTQSVVAPVPQPNGCEFNSFQTDLRSLIASLDRLEGLSKRIDQLAEAVADANVVEERIQKLNVELNAHRKQQDVRERLVEPLRDELIKYRDAFVREVLQKTLVQDLTRLDDDLRNVLDCIKRAAEVKRGRVASWARGFDCSIESLTSILKKLEVSEIEPRPQVDPVLHRVVSYEPTENATEDGKIVGHVKRGLLWRDEVLRREDVIAKRCH
jgi:molecular chaperone GrpE (heat shock protein)